MLHSPEMKQVSMFKRQRLEFGGEIGINPRLNHRPLSSQKLIHLVLKSNEPILRKNWAYIEQVIRKQAQNAGIKIYGLSIQPNHVHHAIRIHNRKAYLKFIRAVTGLLARKFGRGIWKYRPYTRVAEWGKGLDHLKNYIHMNELEATGQIPIQPRKYK